MLRFIDDIPYSILIIVAVFMVPAPFQPMPHAVEKILMLINGNLTRPLDIFDLFFHLSPLILMLMKAIRNKTKR